MTYSIRKQKNKIYFEYTTPDGEGVQWPLKNHTEFLHLQNKGLLPQAPIIESLYFVKVHEDDKSYEIKVVVNDMAMTLRRHVDDAHGYSHVDLSPYLSDTLYIHDKEHDHIVLKELSRTIKVPEYYYYAHSLLPFFEKIHRISSSPYFEVKIAPILMNVMTELYLGLDIEKCCLEDILKNMEVDPHMSEEILFF